MLDHDESNLHRLQLELWGEGLLDDDECVVADIRDLALIDEVRRSGGARELPLFGCAVSRKIQKLLDPFRLKFIRPSYGVLVVGVSAVDKDISRLQHRNDFLDRKVHRFTRRNHHPDHPASFQRMHELIF